MSTFLTCKYILNQLINWFGMVFGERERERELHLACANLHTHIAIKLPQSLSQPWHVFSCQGFQCFCPAQRNALPCRTDKTLAD
jgi:hypothetical protein